MAGGTIARHVADGDTVQVFTFTDGVSARAAGREPGDVERRERELMTAVDVLGAGVLATHVFPDNRMDSVPLLEVAQAVEKALVWYRPDIIYTHHAGDLNVDHRIVAQAVATATRPGSEIRKGVRAVYAGETPSSTEWAFGATGPPFMPQRFVALSSKHLGQKQQALACYASEGRPPGHPRYAGSVSALAQWRGAQCGHEWAEAFMVVREVW